LRVARAPGVRFSISTASLARFIRIQRAQIIKVR
jgi:hypothetical protein